MMRTAALVAAVLAAGNVPPVLSDLAGDDSSGSGRRLAAGAAFSSAQLQLQESTAGSAVRLYPHPLSPANHPLRRTKATQPPELKLFGSGTACAHLDSGCTVRKHTLLKLYFGIVLGLFRGLKSGPEYRRASACRCTPPATRSPATSPATLRIS